MAIDPREIVMEFLRARLTDPQGRHSADSDTFNGTGSQTTFTLTATSGSVQAISSVTVGGSGQNKWEDYTIDLQNQQITFLTAPPSGTDNVVVNTIIGATSWIYKDKPRDDLSVTSFPRGHVGIVSAPDERTGAFNSDLHSIVHFQLMFWSKENVVFTIDGRKYEGPELSFYLMNQARLAFKNNEDDVYPNLHSYKTVTMRPDLPFDEIYQSFPTALEFNLQGVNIGE